jgi:hypothetical protein
VPNGASAHALRAFPFTDPRPHDRTTAPVAPAANSTIKVEGLGAVVHGKREWPHPLMDANGDISVSVSGVCINPGYDTLDGSKPTPSVDCSSAAQCLLWVRSLQLVEPLARQRRAEAAAVRAYVSPASTRPQ